MACHCAGCASRRGEIPRRPCPPAPFPGSSIADRFRDWQDALDDETCTLACGAARNDLCICRCQGLHHNAGHDYFAQLPPQPCEVSAGSLIHRNHSRRRCTLADVCV